MGNILSRFLKHSVDPTKRSARTMVVYWPWQEIFVQNVLMFWNLHSSLETQFPVFSQGATTSFQVCCDLKSFPYSSMCNPVPDVYQHVFFQICFSLCHFTFVQWRERGKVAEMILKKSLEGKDLWEIGIFMILCISFRYMPIGKSNEDKCL